MGRKHSYAFHGCIRLDRLCASKRCALRYCTSKKGGEFLVQACSQQVWDTTIGMLEAWCLLSIITQKPLGSGGVDVHIDEFAMHQLEESIHFATTRHESKTVLNDVISVTASMQTQETKWNDSDQAFISKSRLWRISTIIDQLEPLIDDPLLLSDYRTQKRSDLPAMRAWISARQEGCLDAKSARPTAGRRYGRLTSQDNPCGIQGGRQTHFGGHQTGPDNSGRVISPTPMSNPNHCVSQWPGTRMGRGV